MVTGVFTRDGGPIFLKSTRVGNSAGDVTGSYPDGRFLFQLDKMSNKDFQTTLKLVSDLTNADNFPTSAGSNALSNQPSAEGTLSAFQYWGHSKSF